MRGISLLVLAAQTAFYTPLWAADRATAPGVENFHQVNGRIFRGAQPKGEDWDNLAKLGVKTVIDLRPAREHSCTAEKRAVEAAGMHYVNLPLNGLEAPTDSQISKALNLVDGSPESVFIHCRRGADRTGTVIACYRISHDGWTNKRALQEAVSYGMSWVEFGMQRYILNFHADKQTMVAQPPR